MEARHGKFLSGDISSLLFRKTVPMLFGMIALMGFNLVDAYFVGKLGTRQLAAMGFTFPVIMIVISLGLGIGTGASSLISRAIGQGDHQRVRRLTADTALLSLFSSILISVIGLLSMRPVFSFLGADQDMLPLIMEYMGVWYIGLVFVIVPMVNNHAIRAAGDTLFPALIMIFSAVLNIILDPIFIFGYFGVPRMELAGAALATVIARSLTLIASFLIIHYREHMMEFSLPGWPDLIKSWRGLLRIGIPAAGVNLLVSVSVAVVTRLVSVSGEAVVAAYGVAHKLEAFCLHIYMALGSVLAPFTGQNWGARNYKRVSEALSLSFHFSWIFGLAVTAVLAVFAGGLMRLFNKDPQVIEAGRLFLCVVPVSFGAEGIIMFSSTVFSALGHPLISIIMVGMRMLIVFLPIALLGRYLAGYPGVFAAVVVTNFIVCAGVYWWDRKFFKQAYHLARQEKSF